MNVIGTYQANGSIISADGLHAIPNDPNNAEYVAILAQVNAGYGTITPYIAPVIDLSALDTQTLNDALTQPGSVVRALGLVVFHIAKGDIPINSSYTMAQYLALLKTYIR